MIVSKDWLSDYVDLKMPLDELTERLTLTGLNLEGVESIDGDDAIDLEVTSNRPDCLGHIGVAREVSVLWGETLKKPDPQPKATGAKASSEISVEITCPELCPRYTARVIKGVKIGPSPAWLQKRLQALGCGIVNNVVDVTNYVLFECGQPLHAFDLGKLTGGKIIVREAHDGEEFTAIDHKNYKLSAGTCVVSTGEGADTSRAVALGGVMGGADSEVSDDTVDLLIEAADFDPLSIRTTARAHHLHSPSSYRFERGVDPEGVDWASRRCCELILELAGGTLCEGMVEAGSMPEPTGEIKLRFLQIPRLLGIEVPEAEVRKILTDLGCTETHACGECVKVVPPTWRADLTREADLLEEVARIYGYDQIPEDVGVRMAPSHRTRRDIVLDRVRRVLTSAGFDEALTLSTVEPELVELHRPWTDQSPLVTSTPVLRRANALRQSVVPSLLTCRKTNVAMSNPVIEQFEIARIYLPQPGNLPDERLVLAITSGQEFLDVKGVIEAVLADTVGSDAQLSVSPTAEASSTLLEPTCTGWLSLGETKLGYVAQLSTEGLDRFDLRGPVTVAEVDLGPLLDAAALIPRATTLVNYQPMSRDLNVVFDEKVLWADVAAIVDAEGGDLLEAVEFQEVYRDEKRLGKGKKSLLWSITLRSSEGTLTSEQADTVRDKIVDTLGSKLGGELRA
ncbi:phenylalanine--tRNA ligase subunit beta [Aeoliella mucimassa]|uniref:Phenylalanine--tRNA ligase beta subunit n=1 Tax=Aeoliella mucimassa TaxID=2527972 RepID=A0A518AWI3_9BACT|nr:phenylalanine--tRNA ligase subunit beta [Aeoliella mucimassa]QDU59078.1 Phenylalanine--tRNA ligase beta subunit [Aeoliella mucimassa]